MKKTLKIANITIYAVYAVWTLFLFVTYLVAGFTAGFDNLRLDEDAAVVNTIINGMFIANLTADVLYRAIANRKAKTSE